MSSRRPSIPAIIAAGLFLTLCIITLRNNRGQDWRYSPSLSASRALHSLGSLHEAPIGAKTDLLEDVQNATLGFEKIFSISLPSRTDRRDGVTLAAALSGIEIDFIDGVRGETIDDKAIPSGPGQHRMHEPSIGSWRGHLNAIREIVRRNLTSALILEDDVDWDLRLKDQLQNFALSSRALTQPLLQKPGVFADPTFPGGSPEVSRSQSTDFSTEELPNTEEPSSSPYGDNWDILWFGQCGLTFPYGDNSIIPKGRVVQSNDSTVAEKRYLTTWTQHDELKAQYPEHTRVVHHAQAPLCSLGYAVTQKAARQLLYQIGLKNFNEGFDLLLAKFCEGGRGYHTCLSVQPSLFNNYLPVGLNSVQSDISDHGEGWTEKDSTPNTRWSVRLNLESLLEGGELIDQFPDTDEGVF